MNEKHIILAAPARTGNTFLGVCIREAIRLNNSKTQVYIAQNLRAPSLLALDQTEDIKIYTNLRDPLSNIVSSTARKMFFAHGPDYKFDLEATKFDQHVDAAIYEYNEYLYIQNKYMKSTIILFDNLVSHTHSVINNILNDIGLEYSNKINIDSVKHSIDSNRQVVNGNGDFVESFSNLPFGIDKKPYYNSLVEKINSTAEFYSLGKLYSETIDKAKDVGCKIY